MLWAPPGGVGYVIGASCLLFGRAPLLLFPDLQRISQLVWSSGGWPLTRGLMWSTVRSPRSATGWAEWLRAGSPGHHRPWASMWVVMYARAARTYSGVCRSRRASLCRLVAARWWVVQRSLVVMVPQSRQGRSVACRRIPITSG